MPSAAVGIRHPRGQGVKVRATSRRGETPTRADSFKDAVTRSSIPAPAHAADVKPAVVPDSLVPERRGTLAFVSSVARYGDWVLPRHYRALAVMGNLEIDLTRARMGAGTSHIEVMCIMGNVTVLVPPSIRLDCDAIPVVGSLEVRRDIEGTLSPDAPLVQITGTAFMGAIEVKVVDPNAPGWLERLRARWSGASPAPR